MILKSLKWVVDELGINHLSFSSNNIGYLSIHSSTAMVIYIIISRPIPSFYKDNGVAINV